MVIPKSSHTLTWHRSNAAQGVQTVHLNLEIMSVLSPHLFKASIVCLYFNY
jgi:hypothetical protein